MQGMEIICDPVTKAPGTEEVKTLCRASLDLGLSFQIVATPGSCAVFRLAPPITISVEEIDQAISILDQALASLFPKKEVVEDVEFLPEARL
jgi:4-aminobutyrate aminotransferase-like enzyme